MAKTKPTGSAKWVEVLAVTLEAEDAINERSAMGEVEDEPEFQSEDEDEDIEIVEVSDRKMGKVKEKGKEKQETVLTKAFKTEAPLCPKPRRNQATDVLNQISAQLDPAVQQQQDDERATHNFQLIYLQNLQAQLHEEQRHREQIEAQVHELELQLVCLESCH
ncbi:hypothetical protein GYMLUDRAFT_246131 [Collybiopsis luxurians FD-317 M1]|uniref:Uncharacterized protein n=1 Tax=Collybiopsis luxurians FD-317 M1 TaxID=944289 RepID=A0A0D0BSU9_9AGAR|nr:hypothetical protein GYMLUDRAFT_246131 [Collybiopsis luxurians FD-317 M1]